MPNEDELRRERARQRVQARQNRGRSQADGRLGARTARGRVRSERGVEVSSSNAPRTPRQLHEERRLAEQASRAHRSARAGVPSGVSNTGRRMGNEQSFRLVEERSSTSRATRSSRSGARTSRRADVDARDSRFQQREQLRTSRRGATPKEPASAPTPRKRTARATRNTGSANALPARILGFIVGVLGAIAHAVANFVMGLVNRFGLVKLVIGIVVIIVAIVFLSAIPRGCIASNNATTTMTISTSSASSSDSSESSDAVEQQTGKPDDGAQIDEDALINLMGSDDAAAFIEVANSDADVHWIAAHYTQYEVDGYTVQAKLFKLATNEPAARHFVLYWPDKYPQSAGEPLTNSENVITASTGQSVPRYYQWDERWGYTEYSSTTFAVTGCCPTALSMVYTGLTGNTDKTPYDMGVIAVNDGYATTYNGTDASFLPGEASRLGLYCTEVGVNSSELRSVLQQGMVAIINVGAGDFTTSGHYIVAVGLDASGNLVINDPYSEVRSNKTWDIDTVISQTKVIYAYSAA